MISKRELQFVNQYAKNVPFPGSNYALSCIEELIKAYEIYLKQYKNKGYSFIFSNGEEINFEILSKNLSHLLGVDYKNIMSEPMAETSEKVLDLSTLENKTTFGVLERIIERAEEVIKNDSNPNNYKILNYYRIMIKASAFSKLTNFEKINFGCIDFDKQTYEKAIGQPFTPQSTKYFFTTSNEAVTPYFMMGITKDNYSNLYVPETIMAPENFEAFFQNQTLLLPIQLLVNDNFEFNKIKVTNEEKLKLLNMYKYIISAYKTNSFIDIYNDYENTLRETKILNIQKH